MNRRRFLSLLGLGVAGVALEQAIPLGRVWSFPKEIVAPISGNIFLTSEWITRETLRMLQNHLQFLELQNLPAVFHREFSVGDTIEVKLWPQLTLQARPPLTTAARLSS